MFRVIVLGGIALAASAPAAVAGCGGSVSSSSDGGSTPDAFPVEGAADVAVGPVDAFPQETAPQADAFPQEGPAFIDSGFDARFDAALDAGHDAFPQEGPPPRIDSGVVDATASDAPALADGFPQETAQQVDP